MADILGLSRAEINFSCLTESHKRSTCFSSSVCQPAVTEHRFCSGLEVGTGGTIYGRGGPFKGPGGNSDLKTSITGSLGENVAWEEATGAKALRWEQACHSQGPQRPVRGGGAEPLFQDKVVGFYIRAGDPEHSQ